MTRISIYNEEEILKYFASSVLENGYENTSMRNIASHFNMPVSSLYRHFASKEEMLDRLLVPVVELFNKMFSEYEELNYTYLSKMSLDEIFELQKTPKVFIDVLYKYYDEFKILLNSKNGTKYESFYEKLLDKEFDATKRYFIAIKKAGYDIKDIDDTYLRIIIESRFEAFGGMIKKNMSYEDAIEFNELFATYTIEGLKKILIKK